MNNLSDLRDEIKEISIWAYEYFIGEDYDGTDINIKGAVDTFSERLHNKILNLKVEVKCPRCFGHGYSSCKTCKGMAYIEKTLKEMVG